MDGLESALDLIKRGFYVFPLIKNKKIPATANGCNDASNDEQYVRNNWGNSCNFDRNIGIKCENIIVIDVDVKNTNGLNDLVEIENAIGTLPKVCTAKTQSGGFHYYFKRPAGDYIGRAGIEFNGRKTAIDIRVGNQYVVAPPSVIDGNEYQWIKPIPDHVDQLPELPESWKNFLPRKDIVKQQEFKYELSEFPSIQNVRRCRAFMQMKDPAVQGQMGQAKMWEAINDIFNGFDLSKTDGWDILMEYNSRCCPPWSSEQDMKWINYAVDKAISTPQDKGKLIREYDAKRNTEVNIERFEEFEVFEESKQEKEYEKISAYNPFETTRNISGFLKSVVPDEIKESDKKENEKFEALFKQEYGELEKKKQDVPNTMPYELMNIPGFVNHCAEIIYSKSHTYNHHCAVMSALTLLSAIIGEKMIFDQNYANIYVVTLADSGEGKDAARKFVNAAFEHSLRNRGMENCLGESVKSGAALEDSLIEYGRQYYYIDEVRFLFEELASKDTLGKSLLDIITKVYTATPNMFKRRLLASAPKNCNKFVFNPYFTFIGTSAPQSYYSSFSEQMLSEGFYGRLFIIKAKKGTKRYDNTDGIYRQEDFLRIDNFAKWAECFYPGGSNDPSKVLINNNPRRTSGLIPFKIGATNEAKAIINNYKEVTYYKGDQDNLSVADKSLIRRSVEKMIKLCMLYLVSREWERLTSTMDNEGNVDIDKVREILVVDEECASWAYSFTINSIMRQMKDMEDYRYVNEHDKDLKSIKDIVNRMCASSKVGLCTRKAVYRNKRGLTNKQLDEMIDDLIAQEELVEVKIKDARGSLRTGLVTSEYFKEKKRTEQC